ncbi:ArnT family glycosyltransferase [Actinacidiphila sp. bgisy167]|uniref:ArnT family glycosyltransferase n=1 Tax=Actinacidiphila sp. bgisy167 TaxID=3413797 RepID=UPI003D752DEE
MTHAPVSPEPVTPGAVGALRARRFPSPPPPLRRPLYVLAVLALLAQMAWAMVTTAVQQTPTIDEPVYVGTATVYLREHSLRFNPEHPPLGKLLIAGGLAFAHPRLDPSFEGDQTELGRSVLYAQGNDPGRLMRAARLPVIALTLLFGLVVLAFARDLTGAPGGLLALALYAFSPDVIAHGSLATLDVPAAGFLLTSAWALWRARKRPRLHLPLAGSALGAAVATRMSTLPAVPVLLLAAALSVWHADRRGAERGTERPAAGRSLRRAAVAAGGVGVLAVAVVWAAYLVVDPRLRWTAPDTLPALRGLRAAAVDALPLPRAYKDGMAVQFGFEDSTFEGFLFGRHYRGALWYYLPAAVLVKTPLGMLALWLAGAVALLALPRLRPAAPYLLVPAAVLTAAAMTGSRDFGVRYVIFLPMLGAVTAACTTALRRRWAAAAAALAVFVAVSSLRTFPYYLPYSNEAFGGTSKTHLRLHDSNVDWGQDLGRLADRLRERHPGERVWLVYKGSGDPAHYGIDAADPRDVPKDRVHGLLVVSDSAVAKAEGRLAELIAGSEPIDEVGHSITIYRR